MEVVPIVVMIKIMSEHVRFELNIGEGEFFIWSWKQCFIIIITQDDAIRANIRN